MSELYIKNRQDLIDFVRSYVDREAADYLEEHCGNQISINSAFIWCQTPQGDEYWRNIHLVVSRFENFGIKPELLPIVPEDLFKI